MTEDVCQAAMFHGTPCTRAIWDFKTKTCIFHSLDIQNKSQQFAIELQAIIRAGQNDFNGFIFPGNTLIGNVSFPSPVFFRKAKFRGEVNFSGAIFQSNADFSGAEFQGKTIFDNTQFYGETIFNGCKFENGASFQQAVFFNPARFQGVEFRDKNIENENSAERSVVFAGTIFKQDAIFSYCKFQCSVDFTETRFLGDAQFYEVIFANEADFYGVRFSGVATFFKAEFCKGGSFISTTFEKGANFIEAKFIEQTFFSNTKFALPVSFSEATFTGITWFPGVEFCDKALFEVARFEMIAHFTDIKVLREIRFREKTGLKCFARGANFQNITCSKDAVISFEKVDLSQASFLDTNLEQINFRDVRWYNQRTEFKNTNPLDFFRTIRVRRILVGRRRALHDEFYGHGNPDYEKIAENYRQLVLNYERKRDYDAAEDFHIGEMEVRRKKRELKGKSAFIKRFMRWVNGYSMYRALSNYGTSYWHAFGMLLLMIGSFSLIFLWNGFQPSKENLSPTVTPIEYDWFPDSEHKIVGFGQWFDDYKQAVLYTLSIITFQRERFYQPIDGWWPHFWLFISVIVLTSQAALVLLAIRRRFKR